MLKKILQYVLIFGFSGFLVWLSIKDIDAEDWDRMRKVVYKANFLLLFPVLIMAFLSHWFRAMRWRLLLEPIEIKPTKFNAFAAVMIGYFVNMGIPRFGEVLKCTLLAKYEKAPADKILGTIVVERAFDIFCFGLFLCITLLLEFKKIGVFLTEKLKETFYTNGGFNWLKIVLIFGVVFVIIILFYLIFNKYKNNSFIIKFKGILSNIKSGLKTIYTLKRKKEFLLHTLIIWAMYLLEIYAAFFAFEQTNNLSLSVACVALTLGTLGMIATPNGIGSFPLLVGGALLLYGVEKEMGITFGWIMWAVMTGITLVFGVLSFILLPRLNKKNEQSTTTIQ